MKITAELKSQFQFLKSLWDMDLVHLPEWTLDENVFKRISVNSNPKPKAQKSFRENKTNDVIFRASVQKTCNIIYVNSVQGLPW